MKQNIFKYYWKDLETKNFKYPTRVRKIISYNYKNFSSKILNQDKNFAKKVTKSLIMGDIYILKKAFPKIFFDNVKKKCIKYFKNTKPSFHKMVEGCPDFHREIDIDTGKKYSFKLCKHSYYFYKWNKDPIKIFEETYKRFRPLKFLMGNDELQYENNTPKDGVVDRIQVVQYPSKYGFLEPHSDPYKFQKLFVSGYMSKKGKDYKDGGFYAIDLKDKIKDVEKFIDVGDIGIGFGTIIHGVAPVNLDKEPEWDNINDGRWFYSMYSNQSDMIKKRHTGYSAVKKIKIKNFHPVKRP